MEGGNQVSRTIDERIVEMRFDNAQFQQNIQDSIDSLERLKSELDLQESAKGLNKLSKAGKSFSLASVSESVEGIASKFSTMGIIGVTALQNITNSAMAAGKKIVDALTVQPVSTGFNEYELKMDSIKTIMSGSGESLETVKKYLEELNKYSDETIYSFSDMTSNIGKFTNAGVKLGDAVAAIKGISNEAALAGASANEASRAMYNFAQAMSSGYVKLIDWKSIELANMATVDFKKELMKTALEIGTIKDLGNGMFESLTTDAAGNVSDAFNATRGFNDSLAHTWMTNDVLVQTLSKYASATTDIGKRATEAAQEVRTFTKMMDTLKESAQSGWSTTWELLVGDMEEATRLLTTLSNIFGDIIQKMAESRNNKLSEWLDLGGKQTIYDAFGYLHNTIVQIGTIMKESFREFFPASTGKTLLTFTEKFRDGMKELFKFVYKNKDTIRSIFDGVFSVLKAGVTIVNNVRKGIVNLIRALLPAGEGFMGLVERLSEYLVDVSSAIRDSELLESAIMGVGNAVKWATGAIGKFVEFIKELFTNADMSGLSDALRNIKENFNPLQNIVNNVSKLMDGLGKAFEWVKKALGNLGGKFKGVFDEIGTAIKDADLETLLKWVNLILTGGLVISLTSLVSTIKRTVKDFGDIFEIFDSLGALIGSHAFVNLAKGMLMVAGALVLVGTIPSDKILSTIGTFTGAFTEMLAAVTALYKMLGGGDDEKIGEFAERAKALSKLGLTMALMGASLLLCAGAVKQLASLKWQEALIGVLSLGGIMATLVMTMRQMDMLEIPLKTAAGILIMAVAMGSLARTVKKIGNFDPEVLNKGYIGLMALLGGVMLFVNYIDEKQLLSTAAGIIAIGIAVNKLTSMISLLGGMDIQSWAQGLGGVALLMLTLGVAISKMPKEKAALAGAVGIRVIASALNVIGESIKDLSTIPWQGLLTGGIALIAMLGAIVIAMLAMEKIGVGGNTIIGVLAILAIAAALRILAPAITELASIDWMGVLKILAVFAIILAAGLAASYVAAGLIVLAGSMLLMGLACLSAGAGINMFASAMDLLSKTGGKGAKVLFDIFQGVIELIPLFFQSIGEGIVGFATAIGEGSAAIREAIVEVGSNVISASTELGFKMITSFLNAIRDGAQEAGTAVREAVISVLQAVQENVPYIIDEGGKLLISILNGLADALENNYEELRKASKRVGEQIGKGLLIGVESTITGIVAYGEQMGRMLIGGTKEGAEVNSPSKATIEIGEFVGEGLIIGTNNKMGGVYDSGYNLGETAIEGLADGADTHSPSIAGISIGEGIGDGLSIGGLNSKSSVYDAFEELGFTSLDALGGFKMDFFEIGNSVAESYNEGLTRGMYAYADPMSQFKDMLNEDIETHKKQDLLDPSMLRMQKVLAQKTVKDVSTTLDTIETKTEKTRKEMTTGIGDGIIHRLAHGLKLYSEQALKAAEEAKENTLRPITDMTKSFDIDTSKINSTFAKLANDASKLNAELELDNNVTVNHTFDKLTIEGVNNKGEFVASADYSVEKIITSLMRRQARV